jgi:hypothetical protein
MTAECQPLDRRLSGNLKSRARAKLNALCQRDQDPSMPDSIASLLDASRSISQFEILDAWETPTH